MFALVLAVAALAAIASQLPLRDLPDAVARLGPLAPVLGVVVGAALLIAMIPRTPVSLACGLLFGALPGAVCALLVSLIAATVTFAAGRWLGRDFVARYLARAGTGGRLRRQWARLETWVTREGVLAVGAVRALPIGPYGLAGYVYGTSGIRVRHYSLGTLIAAAPSAISYAMVGAAVARPGSLSPIVILPIGFGLALSAAVLLRARWVARNRPHDPPGDPENAATRTTPWILGD